MRLGEVLVKKGLISNEQLKVALDAQLIWGGHLGSCLVELGHVDPETLGDILAESFRVQHAHREMLADISHHVIKALPQNLVKKHTAVPFDLKGRILHIAMINPRNLLAMDELSFASSYRIEAWIAPAILINRAMERYYDIPVKQRFIAASRRGQLDQPGQGSTGDSVIPPSESPAPAEALAALVGEPAQVAAPPVHQEFDVQKPSQVYLDRVQPLDGARSMTLKWAKYRGRWCDLFNVDLDHEHFNDLTGLYVAWHNGPNPVVLVGSGLIRERLAAHRQDPVIREAHEQDGLFVTWALVEPDLRAGILRYLADMLSPAFRDEVLQATPIEVNLPRATMAFASLQSFLDQMN